MTEAETPEEPKFKPGLHVDTGSYEGRTRAVQFVPDDRYDLVFQEPLGASRHDILGWAVTPDGYVQPVLWDDRACRPVLLPDHPLADRVRSIVWR